MKKMNYLLAIIFLLPLTAIAQNKEDINRLPLIGEKAPSFHAESTSGNITFPEDFKKNWKILFSHPADFTPVCTSELIELAAAQADFSKLGVNIAVISTDLIEHHKLWIKSMEELSYRGKKTTKIDFPIIADPKFTSSKLYGMMHPESGTTKDVRGVYIIDPSNTVRSIMFYPMEIGRNMKEIERTVIALQKFDSEHVLTPANWNPGDDVIVPFLSYTPGLDTEEAKKKDPNIYSVSWYLHMKKDEPIALK